MSWFPRPVGPIAALRDLAAFMRQRSREQLVGGALAVLVTTIIVILFLVDAKINTGPGEEIVHVSSWPASRTDAEIIAQQKRDQAALDAARKQRQEQFRKLEKDLGI